MSDPLLYLIDQYIPLWCWLYYRTGDILVSVTYIERRFFEKLLFILWSRSRFLKEGLYAIAGR